MKVVIQIPCLNEEECLPKTLEALPRKLRGVDTVEWLVIDDGSMDDTVKKAWEGGVDKIVSHPKNLGLARAFMTGLDAALEMGADIIVNTDADNQYRADCIQSLIEPILTGRAEIVVGSRPITDIEHFSPLKKALQRLGSWVVRIASRTDISDAPSGFRAMSRRAAMQLNVFNEYTYTLETIIQAGQKGIPITSIPIKTNEDLRPSRLISSIPAYINRSVMTIARIFMTYRPFKFFAIPGVVSFLVGLLLALRFLYFYFIGAGGGHVQSVIMAALFMGTGFFLVVTGLVADLVSVNRKLLEKLDLRTRMMEDRMSGDGPPAGGE